MVFIFLRLTTKRCSFHTVHLVRMIEHSQVSDSTKLLWLAKILLNNFLASFLFTLIIKEIFLFNKSATNRFQWNEFSLIKVNKFVFQYLHTLQIAFTILEVWCILTNKEPWDIAYLETLLRCNRNVYICCHKIEFNLKCNSNIIFCASSENFASWTYITTIY